MCYPPPQSLPVHFGPRPTRLRSLSRIVFYDRLQNPVLQEFYAYSLPVTTRPWFWAPLDMKRVHQSSCAPNPTDDADGEFRNVFQKVIFAVPAKLYSVFR